MNRDSPSLNELYGVGAEEADSEALEKMNQNEEREGIRYVVETRRGNRDPDWGHRVISRSYFETEEEAQREVDGRARDGKILGRTYTIKREEFDIELDADTSTGEHSNDR